MIRLQQNAKGLGSNLLITLITTDEENAQSTFKQLWAQINAFEQRFSRFIENSEISNFNKKAGYQNHISSQFRQLLEQAKNYSISTGGLFNPFVLPALQKSGYKGSWPEVHNFNNKIDFSDRLAYEAKEIKIYKNSAQIPANSAIDFGGIGKGFLLDLLAEKLLKKGYENFWISLGGDIICHGFDLDSKPWSITIEGLDGHEDAGIIVNSSGTKMAIASSGIIKRKGANWHHIIDPRYNQPAKTDILVATIATDNATEADIYAKSMVILGSKDAESLIKTKKYYATALQISHNGNVMINKTGNIQ